MRIQGSVFFAGVVISKEAFPDLNSPPDLIRLFAKDGVGFVEVRKGFPGVIVGAAVLFQVPGGVGIEDRAAIREFADAADGVGAILPAGPPGPPKQFSADSPDFTGGFDDEGKEFSPVTPRPFQAGRMRIIG